MTKKAILLQSILITLMISCFGQIDKNLSCDELETLAISQTACPELVSSAGESFKNSTYQLDWSVGDCITATHTKNEFVITQGFHQGKYVITTTLENLQNVGINISVFPNPTTDIINLQVESSKTENLQYTLIDISGKILQNREIKNKIEQLA